VHSPQISLTSINRPVVAANCSALVTVTTVTLPPASQFSLTTDPVSVRREI
jgi:hypothetical protein